MVIYLQESVARKASAGGRLTRRAARAVQEARCCGSAK